MTKFIKKDINYRMLFLKEEKNILLNKFFKKSKLLPNFQKWTITENSLKKKFKNRCIISGRGRSVLRNYKLSRIILKKFSVEKLIPNVEKDS